MQKGRFFSSLGCWIACGFFSILTYACTDTLTQTDTVTSQIDPYATHRATVVEGVELVTTTATIAQISWQPHASTLQSGYWVRKIYNASPTVTSATAPLIPFFGDRASFDSEANTITWLWADKTSLLASMYQAGIYNFVVYAEFPDGSLSEGSTSVVNVVAAGEVTGESSLPPDIDEETDETSNDEICVLPTERAATLINYQCYDFLTYGSPGSDGVWGNDDDVATGRFFNAITATQQLIFYPGRFAGDARLEATYSGAGLDGLWQSADDILQYYFERTPPPGNIIYPAPVYQVAATSCIRRETDVDAYYAIESVSGSERVGFYFDQRGYDLTWGSADDRIAGYFREYLNGNAAVTDAVWITQPGFDGDFYGSDDFIGHREKIFYDVANQVTEIVLFGNGADGVLQTSDDIGQIFSTYHYNLTGQVVSQRNYQTQATGVTDPTTRIDFLYTATQLSSIRALTSGVDQILGNADDVTTGVAEVQQYTCNAP